MVVNPAARRRDLRPAAKGRQMTAWCIAPKFLKLLLHTFHTQHTFKTKYSFPQSTKNVWILSSIRLELCTEVCQSTALSEFTYYISG